MKQTREVSYSILKLALTRKFGVPESEHDVILKLSLRRQHYKESCDDFHSSVLAMNRVLRDNRSHAPVGGKMGNVCEINLPDEKTTDLEFIDPQIEALISSKHIDKGDYSKIK
ncbi:hypothetical protein DOY81_007251, partial [Sarcophaga bullata]